MHATTSPEPDPAPALSASSLLLLMWLASPALPVGGFSYSEGLESAVDSGLASTESEASDWLVHQLHMTLVRSDLAVVAKAVGAWRRAELAQGLVRVQFHLNPPANHSAGTRLFCKSAANIRLAPPLHCYPGVGP